MRLGVISDTHGMLRPQVFEVFREVDHILHGGDIGAWELIVELQALAPVTAVYGNTDGFDIRSRVPQVVVPFTAEQTYWAKRSEELGVSPAAVVPVDATSIYQGIQEALKLRQKAESIPAVENGADIAASIIEHVAERSSKTEV